MDDPAPKGEPRRRQKAQSASRTRWAYSPPPGRQCSCPPVAGGTTSGPVVPPGFLPAPELDRYVSAWNLSAPFLPIRVHRSSLAGPSTIVKA
jgi:hypothetical protein